ncbi:MAG: LptF/LptG family permease [Raineya sp.]|jgi:lipopolysaccharide export system permease protein|nr:LptF/LptG family permease [Raineya sp.]
MRFFKKIDLLILKAFIPSFLLTYFVVVFLLLLQMMMSYVDEFVGKDVGMWTFTKMLYYFALHLTPLALPLAILLSSLMAYGNLGEHFELTAIKSAGISLTRTLLPIGIFALLISGVSFWFSNTVVPYSNIKAFSTLYNIKQTKATLDLKEGVFYDGIPNYSIKVGKKYPDGKTLKTIMIYTHQDLKGNKEVILADSGRMYTMLNGDYLVMELFNGNSYTEYSDGASSTTTKFVRNQYKKSKLVFSLSAFKNSDIPDSLFKHHRFMKNVVQLKKEVDSFHKEIKNNYDKAPKDIATYYIQYSKELTWDSLTKATFNHEIDYTPQFVDSLYNYRFDSTNTRSVLQRALNQSRSVKGFLEYRRAQQLGHTLNIREHAIELHKKFTFALGCFIMFLIGAPLGSIIKKGGLGVPILVSVFFFILYYTTNMFFEKWAKEGLIDVIVSMWIPNTIFVILGTFFLIQARNDSRVFEVDNYVLFFKRMGRALKIIKREPELENQKA